MYGAQSYILQHSKICLHSVVQTLDHNCRACRLADSFWWFQICVIEPRDRGVDLNELNKSIDPNQLSEIDSLYTAKVFGSPSSRDARRLPHAIPVSTRSIASSCVTPRAAKASSRAAPPPPPAPARSLHDAPRAPNNVDPTARGSRRRGAVAAPATRWVPEPRPRVSKKLPSMSKHALDVQKRWSKQALDDRQKR